MVHSSGEAGGDGEGGSLTANQVFRCSSEQQSRNDCVCGTAIVNEQFAYSGLMVSSALILQVFTLAS